MATSNIIYLLQGTAPCGHSVHRRYLDLSASLTAAPPCRRGPGGPPAVNGSEDRFWDNGVLGKSMGKLWKIKETCGKYGQLGKTMWQPDARIMEQSEPTKN